MEPKGTRIYPSWIGARVEIVAGGVHQSQVILAGGSYASQSALRAVFGMGDAARADRVIVHFPGGKTQQFEDVAAGTVLKVDLPPPG